MGRCTKRDYKLEEEGMPGNKKDGKEKVNNEKKTTGERLKVKFMSGPGFEHGTSCPTNELLISLPARDFTVSYTIP